MNITETFESKNGNRRVVIENASWSDRPFRWRVLSVKRTGRRVVRNERKIRTMKEAREFAKEFVSQ